MSLKSGTHPLAHMRIFSVDSIPLQIHPLTPFPLSSSATDAFPSSLAFDAINSALQSSPTERADAVKKGNAIFAFTLKNNSGDTESWHIDLKEKGEVIKGAPAKADVSLALTDDDFGKMVAGKTQAQRLFMSGKLKIKGDVMKATKMEPILKKAQGPKAKL